MDNIIDQYGVINQRIAELEEAKQAIKSKILERGEGFYSGVSWIVSVSEYDRDIISAQMVRKLSSLEFIKSVTTTQHIKSLAVKPMGA